MFAHPPSTTTTWDWGPQCFVYSGKLCASNRQIPGARQSTGRSNDCIIMHTASCGLGMHMKSPAQTSMEYDTLTSGLVHPQVKSCPHFTACECWRCEAWWNNNMNIMTCWLNSIKFEIPQDEFDQMHFQCNMKKTFLGLIVREYWRKYMSHSAKMDF